MVTTSKVVVIWNARMNDGYDVRLPGYLKMFTETDLPRLIILLVPLRNGLFKIKIIACRLNTGFMSNLL